MADISHKDLLESLGNSAAGFTKNLANQVANFACDLYNRYPWALTFGDTGNFSKGVWDELCRPRPSGVPLPPSAPFTGGQCPTIYQPYVTFSYEGLVGTDRFNFPLLWGEIASIEPIPVASGERGPYGPYFDIIFVSKGDANSPRQSSFVTTRVNRFGSFKRAEKIEVVRQDGRADDCGNLSGGYPQTPIPPSARSTSINIDVHGTTYNVPITVQPTINKYNINIDAGDLSFVFDLSGVTINSNPIIKTINNIEGGIIDLSQDVTNLTQIVTPFINNSVNFNSSFNLGVFQTTEDSGSSSPADEEQSDNIAYVTLDITRKPVNAKTQEGELAQDLVYAGWFQFAAKGYYFPREPIHFSKAIFKAPFGATDYAYTLYEGFEAKVVVHRV